MPSNIAILNHGLQTSYICLFIYFWIAYLFCHYNLVKLWTVIYWNLVLGSISHSHFLWYSTPVPLYDHNFFLYMAIAAFPTPSFITISMVLWFFIVLSGLLAMALFGRHISCLLIENVPWGCNFFAFVLKHF